jgi:hypothetical protein
MRDGKKYVWALMAERALPRAIKVDNGSEFISKTTDRWAYENRVELDFSRPGKPIDSAKVESFNGRLREECLNAHWFLSLDDARRKIDAWRRYYNEARPHTELDDAIRVRSREGARLLCSGSNGAGNFYCRAVLNGISLSTADDLHVNDVVIERRSAPEQQRLGRPFMRAR